METWLPVPGYEGLYEVSDTGSVRAMRRVGTAGGLKKTPLDQKGYPHTSLCKNGKQKTLRVHILVALAFHGPCPPGMEVRHLDGNPTNNSAGNLAYGTSSENNLDTVRHRRHWGEQRTHCSQGHEFTPSNTRIDRHRDGSFKQRTCRKCAQARVDAWKARHGAPTSQKHSDH